jgi:4-amino-4-deoxy-L-arabinose transferase-like glycosyltransferase
LPSYSARRWILFAVDGLALFFLYLFGLTRTGLLSADEPRYAAVGRAMAATGDWLTPRLWGQPWFEKPALLYWMTAVAFKFGLDQDLAPRLPVALASIAFLVFYWMYVRRHFGESVAFYASAILATSVGWLAYSRVAVTDLPMSACFAVAMLLAATNPIVAGLFLGLAILAKGLVPLALFLPAVWYLQRQPVRIAWTVGIALAVAAPWYIAVTVRNGWPFINEFFIKHHFARFATGALLHERPFWFYVPVLAGAVFPWTPLLAGLCRRSLYQGREERFLLAWVLFGFVFFSISRNKLPGYLLPLLPALGILMALGLAQMRDARWALSVSGALLGLVPAIADALPQALAEGASHTRLHLNFPCFVIAAGLASLPWLVRLDWALGAIAGAFTILVVYVVWTICPILDQTVSARQYWFVHSHDRAICTDSRSRSWRYGLDYYAQRIVPDCNHTP